MASIFPNKQIIVRGLLINYLSAPGSSAGPTVLFLHGWQAQSSLFEGAMQKLSAQNIASVALDFPGFGKSQMPASGFFISDYSNVVAEFIQKSGLKNVVIAGHSFGGRVGIRLAADTPHLVSKLILVDAAGIKNESPGKTAKNLISAIFRPVFRLSFLQPMRNKIYALLGASDYVNISGVMRETFLNTINEDLQGKMKNVQAPTLLIYGRNDQDTPVSLGQLMNSLIPGSRLEILEDAGHFSFLDQPEKFFNLIFEFINK